MRSRGARRLAIVEPAYAERERQKIEEAVVAGEQDEELQAYDGSERGLAHTAGPEEKERHHALDEEGDQSRELLEPLRKVRERVRDRRRDGLRPVVVVECREIVPVRIAARELDRGRGDHETEQKPAREPKHDGARRV